MELNVANILSKNSFKALSEKGDCPGNPCAPPRKILARLYAYLN